MEYQRTSKWAYARALPYLSQRCIEYAELICASSNGMNCWEIELATGHSHQTVSGTLTHMRKNLFLIRDMGKGTERPSQSGQPGIVYKVIGGQRRLEALKKEKIRK